MSNTYEMKQLTGTLFTETNVTVPRKGKVKFFDNKEWYCNILKYTGEKEKYEFCVSLGLLHYNAPEEKKSTGTPDIGGNITLPVPNTETLKSTIFDLIEDKVVRSKLLEAVENMPMETVFKCGGWQNVSEKGVSYTKIKLTPRDKDGNLIYENTKEISATNKEDHSDVPF